MTTLAELIRQRKAGLGLSFRQMGQRAVAAGAETEPNWSHLANRPLREFPKMRTIYALARALEVSPEEVAQAALESLGLSVKQTDSIGQPGERWIIVSAEGLNPGDETAIRKTISDEMERLRAQKSS
jgi:hypothetical protein